MRQVKAGATRDPGSGGGAEGFFNTKDAKVAKDAKQGIKYYCASRIVLWQRNRPKAEKFIFASFASFTTFVLNQSPKPAKATPGSHITAAGESDDGTQRALLAVRARLKSLPPHVMAGL